MRDTSRLIPLFLERLAQKLRMLRRTGHFSDEWLLDGTYNSAGRLHGRLWGAMIQAVPDGYVPNVEERLATPGYCSSSFKPDLIVAGPSDELEMMVELESTNSSDRRVIYRDIRRLCYLAEAERHPSVVLLLTVLPSAPVKYLKMWDNLSKKRREERRSNPYAFHCEAFASALDGLLTRGLDLSVGWANLDLDGIRLEFWDGRYERRRFWPTT